LLFSFDRMCLKSGYLYSYLNSFRGYRFAFNGKELDREGLGGGGSTYDYGFRIYNAQLAKFLSVDPLTASFAWSTPYQFAGNSPILNIDLDGMESSNTQEPEKVDNGGVSTNPSQSGSSGNNSSSGAIGTEASFLKNNPSVGFAIGTYMYGSDNISTVAANFANNSKVDNVSQEKKGKGTERNAVRHTLWQALVSQAYGYSIAKMAADAHESNPNALQSRPKNLTFNNLEDADQFVDLMNNIIGRQIGMDNPNATPNELAGKVLDRFASDGLWVVNNTGPKTFVVQLQVLSAIQVSEAKANIANLNATGYTPKQKEALDKQFTEKAIIILR
jgi:RHS repeat-associated protein